MAGGLNVVAVVAAVAPLLLLAGVARADCFNYCFKNCIANDKSMTDYCNYACDKTCDPGTAPQRPLAAGAGDMGCQLSCARTSCNRLAPDCKAVEACFGSCYDGCRTNKPLPRPLRAGVSTEPGPVFSSSEPDRDDAATEKDPSHEKQDGTGASASTASGPIFRSSEPDRDDAATKKHPFHEKQDGAGASVSTSSGPAFPSSEPDRDDAATQKHPSHEKPDGVRPSSEEPDPDCLGHPGKPSSSLNCNFHEKQDGVQPASEQHSTPLSEIHAAPPAST